MNEHQTRLLEEILEELRETRKVLERISEFNKKIRKTQKEARGRTQRD